MITGMKINSLPEQKVLIDCYQVSAFGFNRCSSLYVTDVDSGQLVHKLHFKKDEQLYSMARLNNWQVLCISASSDMTSYTIYVLTLPKFTFEELYCITDIVSELEYEVAFPYAVFLYRNSSSDYCYCKIQLTNGTVSSRVLESIRCELILISVRFSTDLGSFMCFSFGKCPFKKYLIYYSFDKEQITTLKRFSNIKLSFHTYLAFEWNEENVVVVPMRKNKRYRLTFDHDVPLLIEG